MRTTKRSSSKRSSHRRIPRRPAGELSTYRAKRNFDVTAEPAGNVGQPKSTALRFVIQKHDASHLHYDFRLEFQGVLKSWAVPKGPSLDPARKSLAIEVEDHPLEYGSFEGTIPQGQYGGGTVLLWDEGTWQPLDDPAQGLVRGKLRFQLFGHKLQGAWTLVRMHRRPGQTKNQWLLMKTNDEFASTSRDILADEPQSVKTERSLEQIASGSDSVWQSNRNVAARATQSSRRHTASSAKLHAAETSPAQGEWPQDIAPQLAVLAEHAPEGDQWLHEIKFDGYRLLAYIRDGGVALMTRSRQDWTAKFPAIARALSGITTDAILDGEVVMLNAQGQSDFQALQNVLKEKPDRAPLVYYVFDLLFENGEDLRRLPLAQRKERLEKLLAQSKLPSSVRYSDHMRGEGAAVARRACAMDLEGIISKRADGPYIGRRDASWLKSKCHLRQEMVIIGFTEPAGSRKGLGSLLLGYYDGNQNLIYCGRVGTGFDHATLVTLRKQLDDLQQDSSPLSAALPASQRKGAHWVRPTLVAEIEFSNWTRDHIMRHPAFMGLRLDKAAKDVRLERAIEPDSAPEEVVASKGKTPSSRKSAPAHASASYRKAGAAAALATKDAAPEDSVPADSATAVRITHPDKILYPQDEITKQDLIDYYTLVQSWMLPHIINRPLTLLRCPGGAAGQCFFQRNWSDNFPPAVGKIHHGGDAETQIVIADFPGLLSLVQMNVLEIHTWNCTAADLDHPDQIVFDLDPGPDVPWKRVLDAARQIKNALDGLALPTFLKTSGGKGLHITVPIIPNVPWDGVKSFAQQVAQSLVKSNDLFVANMRKDLRHGKIYVDFQRNSRTATAAAPYSTRARPGAAISMPIAWRDLDKINSGDQFTVSTAAAYLKKRRADPWADFNSARVDLKKIAAK